MKESVVSSGRLTDCGRTEKSTEKNTEESEEATVNSGVVGASRIPRTSGKQTASTHLSKEHSIISCLLAISNHVVVKGDDDNQA